ncbi:MAG: CGGC domain-containing protein [Candidatus Hydrothermarchaeaceae archaeon]
MSSCFRSMKNREQAFTGYDDVELVGMLPCRCPGDVAVGRARKLVERKGAEVIHFVTCAFADKISHGIYEIKEGSGYCDNLDAIMKKVCEKVGVKVVKGTVHLPAEYEVEVLE